MIEHKRAELAGALRELVKAPDSWELRTEQFVDYGHDEPMFINLIRIWRGECEQRLTMQEAISDVALETMAIPLKTWAGWVVDKWHRDRVELQQIDAQPDVR